MRAMRIWPAKARDGLYTVPTFELRFKYVSECGSHRRLEKDAIPLERVSGCSADFGGDCQVEREALYALRVLLNHDERQGKALAT